MKDKNPIDEVHFYKKNDPDRATKIDKREVGVNVIPMKLFTTLGDLYLNMSAFLTIMHFQVSFLLPEKFAEQQIRFYCKTNEVEKLEEAKKALDDWCKKQRCSLVYSLCIDDFEKNMIKTNTLDFEVLQINKVLIILSHDVDFIPDQRQLDDAMTPVKSKDQKTTSGKSTDS